jgi:GxxExxY protein
MALAGDAELNRITGLIIRGAISVHRALGPGLLESAYTACLAYEARELGLSVDEDVPLPLNYKGINSNAVTESTCASMNPSSSR